MRDTPRYTAQFVNDIDLLKSKYPPVHENEFYHHCTTEYRPKNGLDGILIGEQEILYIYGRITSEKVDTILVKGSNSKKTHPHITLSTALGVKPSESDSEIVIAIQNNTIVQINDIVTVTQGYYSENKEYILSN